MIEKLLEKIREYKRRDEKTGRYIYTNREFIDFIVGIFEGKEAEVERIERKDERYYRIKLDREWFFLEYDRVMFPEYKNEKHIALYREEGGDYAYGDRVALISRYLNKEEVGCIFKNLEIIFEGDIIHSTNSYQDILSEIHTATLSFKYLSKISDNIYIAKKGDDIYTLIHSESYKNSTLTHILEIYNGDDKIKEFEGNSSAVNSLFKYLNFITEASAAELSEVNKLSEMIQELET